jgi:DNA-binding MarR family transcriptional regulator
MTSPPPPPESSPASAVEVMMALRFAERATRKAVRTELAGSGVHAGQEVVLDKLLRHGAIRVAHLALMLDVQVPTATKTTQRMETAGLVRRTRHSTDARQVQIELTEQGKEVAEHVRRLQMKAGRRALRGFDAEQRRMLRNLLWQVIENVESSPGATSGRSTGST